MIHRFVSATALLVLSFVVTAGAAEQPNIILMMADDMGMGDTSAFQDVTGNEDEVQIDTPAMERLARMGIRMTDAHTPSSRCTPTRYGLMTGRYPWRNRMKHWVLFGSQGDPMIEPDRPTIASMLKDQGYATAMVGKWHVGLRYRQSDGRPADGWKDADLTQPLHTTPIDHGFENAWFTSRSHGTSGPDAGATGKGKGKKNNANRNGPMQNVGPGHIDGRVAIAATGNGKRLDESEGVAYVLRKLGSRHSDRAIDYLNAHLRNAATKEKPFFLYYPSNSNHSPYTPDVAIGGKPVQGAARTKSGKTMDARHDFVYENDVALGRLLDWLESNPDPRQPEKKLIETTLVIFTSDNGAERNSDIATGPFRSHKGSVYEGGHRVPLIASWPAGKIGDGDPSTSGQTNATPMALQDLYATFAEITGVALPDLAGGKKGAEDSHSVLAALRNSSIAWRPPLFFNDHKEAESDPAAAAIRLDSPTVDGTSYPGKWKLFFDASLLRAGQAQPVELFNLADDQWETRDLIEQEDLQPLVRYLVDQALLHRRAGGHRLAAISGDDRTEIDFRSGGEVSKQLRGQSASDVSLDLGRETVQMTIRAESGPTKEAITITSGDQGLGIRGDRADHVDQGESLLIRFDRDVIVESAAIVAGDGTCGGFYQLGEGSPLAIYCVDADIDAKDQSGLLSDIGVLKAGTTLRLDSSPHYGVEAAGSWSLRSLAIRSLGD